MNSLVWAVPAFLAGVLVGQKTIPPPDLTPVVEEVARGLETCSAACTADLRACSAQTRELRGDMVYLEQSVEDCVVPGSWLRVGVVPVREPGR